MKFMPASMRVDHDIWLGHGKQAVKCLEDNLQQTVRQAGFDSTDCVFLVHEVAACPHWSTGWTCSPVHSFGIACMCLLMSAALPL